MSFSAKHYLISVLFGALAVLPSASVFAHSTPNRVESAGPAVVMAPTESVAGTVEQLIVENRVTGATTRYVSLRLRDGSRLPLRGTDADRLQTGAQVQIGGRRNGKALQVESAQVVAPAPKAAVPTTPATTREGTLALLHADDFDAGSGSFLFELHEDNGSVRPLDLAVLPDVLRPRMRVAVDARTAADGASLAPERIVVLTQPSMQASSPDGVVAKAATVNSVLVIMAYFSGGTPPAYTVPQAQQLMTTVANFYNEASYGQQQLSVTVTPNWVMMGITKPATCDYSAIGNAATTAATSAGYNPSNYAFVVYLFPNSSQGRPFVRLAGARLRRIPAQGLDQRHQRVHDVDRRARDGAQLRPPARGLP